MKWEEKLRRLSLVSHSDIYLYENNHLLYYTTEAMGGGGYQKPIVFDCDPKLLTHLLSLADRQISIDQESDFLFYVFMKMDRDIVCICGPFTTRPSSASFILQYTRRHHITSTRDYHIHTCSFQQAEALIQLVYEIFTGMDFPAETASSLPEFPLSSEAGTFAEPSSLLRYRMDNTEAERSHHPFQFENYVHDCIRDGNLGALETFFADPQTASYSSGKLAGSDLKQSEYETLLAINLFEHSAVDGGVNPALAYEVSDLYIQKLPGCRTGKDHEKLFFSALREYIALVKTAQAAEESSLHIKRCKQYIRSHLNTPFSLDDLAEYVHLNRTYLSTLFHTNEGITIREYTSRERIRAAENLLKFSEFSISRISSYLCFQSQSHFGVVFKQRTGLTPGAYRKKNKPQGF